MPEESFEQQARNMAEQFSMEPQPIVWQRVKAAIEPKRKRRAAFIWWLLPLLVACGLGFWLMNSASFLEKKEVNTKQNATGKAKINLIEKTEDVNEKRSAEKVAHSMIKSRQSASAIQNQNTDLFTLNHPKIYEEKNVKQKEEAILFQPQTHYINDENAVKEKDTKRETNASLVQPQTTVLVNSDKAIDSGKTALQRPQVTVSDTAKSNTEIAVKTNDTLKESKDSSVAIINKKKSKTKWHWGMTAELGTSWLGNGLLGDQSKSLSDFLSTPSGIFNGNTQGLSTYLQQRRSGADAALGIAVETNLSKRWFLNGALTYHYQQFNIQTTSFSSLSTALNGNIIKSDVSYRFQSANLYAGIGLLLLHKKNISVALQAGVDEALFLSIKQMHNDSLQSLSTQSFQRWQPSLQFAIPVGIYSKRNIRWQLSPFIRWGLRGLQNSDGSFAHHPLNSAGIKATYFFK